jgi:inhibitor of nuclear factor kappa-B kinase subunit alpha
MYCYTKTGLSNIKMVFSKNDRVLIQELRILKGYGARRILKEFPTKKWSLAGLSRLLKKIRNTGNADRKTGSGRLRTARIRETICEVEELILSQEDKPSTHRSVRQISRETGINRHSVHRIIHKDLLLKCLKRKRAQELTEANKVTRLVRCKQLLKRFPPHKVHFIWFTDEKLFTVATPRNSQNDRFYVSSRTKKKTVPADRLVRTRPTFSQSIMVSVGVSSLGSTELIFVEKGIKINGAYYRDVLLLQGLLPAIRDLSGDYFIFQQDNAPAHRARDTVELLNRETAELISPLQWPPNSPDLNPVDYKIWSVLQDRVYRTRIRDVQHLKERLIEEWGRFDQGIISEAVCQWRDRLAACIRSNGGHFEYRL